MGVRMTAAAAAAIVAISGMAASATTIDRNDLENQVDIDYSSSDSAVTLDPFNLAVNPVDISASFDEDNLSGSLTFGMFSDPPAPGTIGHIQLNFTNEDGTAGVDNETFSGSFGGNALEFQEVIGGFAAEFDTSLLGTSAGTATQFVLNFAGLDLGDQFHVNAARVAPIPLPASLPLLLAALGGLGYLSRRRTA